MHHDSRVERGSRQLLYSVGTAIYPGFERVWWRDCQQVLSCNETLFPHAIVYEDRVVNHAPYNAVNGWTAGINGQVASPDNTAHFEAVEEIMVQYWNGTGDFVGLNDEEGAILVSRKAAAAMESVT